VSYLTHEGTRNLAKDVGLYDDTLHVQEPPHSSPKEHACTAHPQTDYRSGNIFGWVQHREVTDKYWIGEDGIVGMPSPQFLLSDLADDSALFVARLPERN
jgi:hypothetical protein